MKEINCNGLKASVSLNRVRKYFNSIGEGEAIIFIEDEITSGNIVKYAMSKGYQAELDRLEDGFRIKIEKRGCLEVIDKQKELLVLITTNKLGSGNEKLGERLMESYFEALIEEDKLPTKLVFLNEGIKLLIQDSNVIQSIKLLNEMGTRIYVSKMCIDEYQAGDLLKIGDIIEMGDIVGFMNSADDVIKL
jgi:selenium metabolism protein YedF